MYLEYCWKSYLESRHHSECKWWVQFSWEKIGEYIVSVLKLSIKGVFMKAET